MPRRVYNTVPVDLIDCADAIADYFCARGHTIRVEPSELGYPNTPTFVFKRGATKTIVEVDARARMHRLELWTQYARSCSSDVRVAVALSNVVGLDQILARLTNWGVGVYVRYPQETVEIVEHSVPMDISVNVQLPALDSLPARVRALLGAAYDQFAHSHWREGFEEACQ